MKKSKSMRVRERLDHPVVDGDGHWLESFPVLTDYVAEIGGPRLADEFRKGWLERHGRRWYQVDASERMRHRMNRVVWWGLPANAYDRATSMIPALLHERIQEAGIDFALMYPTNGRHSVSVRDDDLRRVYARAINTMAADLFKPYRDRLSPVAIVPINTPTEAIEELDYAVNTLGMKAMITSGWVQRTLPADADWQPDPAKRRVYVDSIAQDAAYDYDPFFAKCMDLKVALTTHIGTMGWSDRTSPTSYVANHLGHFAQAHHLLARGLVMGGVMHRFPKLKVGFLEGGAGWGANLFHDLIGHWKKRNRKAMEELLRPTNIDEADLKKLFQKHATHPRFKGKIDEIVERNLMCVEPGMSSKELVDRDAWEDDFRASKIKGVADIKRIFSENFFFGCEADDPTAAWALDEKINGVALRPLLGSDISHWDLPDLTSVLEEAHELVDDGHLDAAQFRAFTFANVVALHGGMNPDFFKGTVVEKEAAQELARNKPARMAKAS